MKLTIGPFCNPQDSILCNKSYFCKIFFNIIRQCVISFCYHLISDFSMFINLCAPCVLYIGQAFLYSPENAFIYLINKYISLSDIYLVVHHLYK